MRRIRVLAAGLLLATAFTFAERTTSADEGMWLFNNPPRSRLREAYGFELTDGWLEHVLKSCVRFNNGGSGSFVSPDGLVMSNQHVGAEALQALSDSTNNYYRDGFFARTRPEEKPCLNLEFEVLMSIEDVTARVNASVLPAMSLEEAALARQAAKSEIAKESIANSGLRSYVVTMYQGGEYHLYRYKVYTDVRLVFAPEQQIGWYGGDPDNFEYPRFGLDICFFRVYENGAPVKVDHYLKWGKAGPAENELIFVAGHPARTSRLYTVADFENLRDCRLPYMVQYLKDLELAYTAFSARSEENARRTKNDLFLVQNSRKSLAAEFSQILDSSLLARKEAAEGELRDIVASRDDLRDVEGAWGQVESALEIIAENNTLFNLLENRHGLDGTLFWFGRSLLRAAEERTRPNPERLREYSDSALESLQLQLGSEEPIDAEVEQLKLTTSLTWLATQLGYTNPVVQKALDGRSPGTRASELVRGTQLQHAGVRKQLFEGGMAAINAAQDPMVELARSVDAEARAARKRVEAAAEAKSQGYALIAKARFAIAGATTYPDANSTLRLSYGTARGYEEDGQVVPFETTFAGLYQRAEEHQFKPPFDLPQRWLDAKSRLDLQTPLNFVSTADTVGGNSGSPVLNAKGELVGLIHDGNIQSLVLDLIYTDAQARAISVHPQAIIEALRRVCDAGALADEIEGLTDPAPPRILGLRVRRDAGGLFLSWTTSSPNIRCAIQAAERLSPQPNWRLIAEITGTSWRSPDTHAGSVACFYRVVALP